MARAESTMQRDRIDSKTNEGMSGLLAELENGSCGDYLRVEAGGRLIGVYTIADNVLTYRSGTKRLTGDAARKCLKADVDKGGSRFKFVGFEQSGPFSRQAENNSTTQFNMITAQD